MDNNEKMEPRVLASVSWKKPSQKPEKFVLHFQNDIYIIDCNKYVEVSKKICNILFEEENINVTVLPDEVLEEKNAG